MCIHTLMCELFKQSLKYSDCVYPSLSLKSLTDIVEAPVEIPPECLFPPSF